MKLESDEARRDGNGDAGPNGTWRGCTRKMVSMAAEASLDGYSWDELAQIASQMSESGSEEAALQLAVDYHLCEPDGTIDGRRVKSFELANGTPVAVQIAGFYHDTRSDGLGKAGMTFIFKNAVDKHAMVKRWSSRGGWQKSALRTWLDTKFVEQLPSDLASLIVPVDKLTNNAGKAKDPSAVTVTSDRIWTFSLVEVAGNIDWDYGGDRNAERWNAIYNAEGSQYQLFSDYAVKSDGDNVILMKGFDNRGTWWWERTPDLTDFNRYLSVNLEGVPFYGLVGVDASGVVPGFCL